MHNVPTLYLAGKISKQDWRFGPVPALDRDYPEPLDTPIHCGRFICVGPFFIGCDHACGHGPSTHGVAKNSCTYHVAPPRWKVPSLCRKWILRADVVAAWIDDPTCYGTLVEIGWAHELGKPVYLGFARADLAEDMWFAASGPSTWSAVHPDLWEFLEKAVSLGRHVSRAQCTEVHSAGVGTEARVAQGGG